MSTSTHDDLTLAPTAEQIAAMSHLLSGHRIAQALHVVSVLGIPDLLGDGPRECADLATRTEVNADALFRVLRFLAGAEIFVEVAPRRFALTPLGASLHRDSPGHAGTWARFVLAPPLWRGWEHLLHTVRTGETAFDRVHGIGFFAYLERDPDFAALFQEAMTADVADFTDDISAAYDFSGITSLVDVGGGHGLQLASILRAYPEMHGILFDLPAVAANAAGTLAGTGVAGRCRIEAGDFFVAVPAGADAYLLRQIIHDWDDARAIAILRACREAMPASGRVLVIEAGIDADYRRVLSALETDMEMLVSTGGRQRTDDEYATLFAASGFRLRSVVPLGDAAGYRVFEGIPG